MTNKKMSVMPEAVKKPTPEEFVKGAVIQEPADYPWLDPRVREDVVKTILLRLKEPLFLRVQYLSKITNKSQQVILQEIIAPAIEQQIKELSIK